MPTEDNLPELSSPDHKSRIRHRLREKLTRRDSKASKDHQVREEDIQSFLHAPNHGRATTATPKIKSLPEWAPQASTHLPYNAASSQVKPKMPRKPNLSVHFTAAAPTIIGEGGEEALLPVAQLFSSLAITPEPSIELFNVAQGQRPGQPAAASEGQSAKDDLFRPKPLQRRSTGVQGYHPDELPGQCHAHQDFDRSASRRHASFRSSLTRETLREDPHLVRSALAEGNYPSEMTRSEDQDNEDPSSNRLHLPLTDPATSFANSLTPLPSPQPPTKPDVSTELEPAFAAARQGYDGHLESLNRKSPQWEAQKPPPQTSPEPISGSRGFSLRDVAKGLGDDACHDFATRVQSFRNVFLLGLNAITEPSLRQWVTAASWWFLKGRSELELSVRSEPRSAMKEGISTDYLPHNLRQAYVDLTKAWWIVTEMTPSRYPKVKRLEGRGPLPISDIMQSFVDASTAELIQVHLSIVSNLRTLIMSMKRNGRLPPPGLELQRLDTRVFIQYTLLSPSAARLLSTEGMRTVAGDGHRGATSFFPMPIKDTERYFNYGRMFVDVVLKPGETADQTILPCLLSVLRNKQDREITAVVASQDGQVHLVIQPAASDTLSWRDAHWDTSCRCIRLNQRADLGVRIQLSESDFRTVWGIYDYIRSVQKQSVGIKNETLVFEEVLRSFQYLEPDKSAPQFPANRIEHCKIRLFECFRATTQGESGRKIQNGYRLMVVTPRELKTLSTVSHHIGRQAPIVFSFLRDEQGASAMLLKMSKSSRDPSMVMSFEDQTDRDRLYSFLNGTGLSSDEYCGDILGLKSHVILTDQDGGNALSSRAGPSGDLCWKRLQVLCRRAQRSGAGGTAIRICGESDMGSFADRVYLGNCKSYVGQGMILICTTGLGELRMRLEIDTPTRITIPRSPQSDMTMCFADNTLSKELYESLRQMLAHIARSPSLRIFDFDSLQELHTFQELTTGFSVLFDGFAKTFAISRRRMVVPIHKRWEATTTRLQVVKHEKTVQLLAFFQDFSHGSCMNFVLKSTDVFESFARSGIPYLCIVDAKFALPSEQTDTNHEYVCLELPEYPGEHDDISIGFENEQGKHSRPYSSGPDADPYDRSRQVH